MESSSQLVRFGPYLLDPRERSLLRHGQTIRLTPKLFETLLVLVQNAGRRIERSHLISAVWKDAFVEEGNLTHNISALRKILGDGPDGRDYIETMPRHGYRFTCPVEFEGNGMGRPDIGSQTFAVPRIGSIAVLPLVNFSQDVEQEYFADGMTEALIAGLAQVLPLRVISRTSVMRYKGKPTALPVIGRELNVDALVEGSIFRSGERVRITVQLIYAPEDRHLWARSYERNVEDVLTLQNELADAIASEIRIKLDHPQPVAGTNIRPVSAAAYEEYLKGRYSWNLRTEAGLHQSIERYHNALARDPQYALAYAGLADSYALIASRRLGDASPLESVNSARDAAIRALDLDANLAEAHLSLAMLRFQYEWNRESAEAEFQRAIVLNPNAAASHHRYAMFLATLKRFSEAMLEIERARVLDPLSPIVATAVGRILHFQRKYDEAIQCHRRALAIDPGFIEAHFNLGMIYEQKAMFPEAILEFREVLRNAGGDAAFWSAGLGHAYGMAGMEREAREVLELLERPNARRGGVSPFDVGWVHLGLGEIESALEWMEVAFKERSGALVYQCVEPSLDPLRSDPRFLDLVLRIGLWS